VSAVPKRRRWWQAYFVLVFVLTAVGLVLPLSLDDFPEMVWWEWVYVPIYLIQVAGLYGFAFWRRIGIPRIWQYAFVASLAYAIWDLFGIATETSGAELFVVFTIAGLVVLEAPMLLALFLYGFRCTDLWRPANEAAI
jgi:hypothetical protein